MSTSLPSDVQELLDRWVRAIEKKDLEALSRVFRRGGDLSVFWSNGERNSGWEEVQRHIRSDFQKDVTLRMEVQEPHWVPLGIDAGILSYRYGITLSVESDSLTCRRLATMSLHREAAGWRVAALHVSNAPGPEASAG